MARKRLTGFTEQRGQIVTGDRVTEQRGRIVTGDNGDRGTSREDDR